MNFHKLWKQFEIQLWWLMQFPSTGSPSSLPPHRGLVPPAVEHAVVRRGGVEAEPGRAEAGSEQAEEAALQPPHIQHNQEIRQQVRGGCWKRRRRQKVRHLPGGFRDEAVRDDHTLQPHVS